MPGKLTEEDVAELRLRYDLGLSIRQLAERFQITPESVRRRIPPEKLRGRGPARGPRAVHTDVRDDEVVHLRDVDGLSWAQLGERVGMSWSGARHRYERAKRRAG